MTSTLRGSRDPRACTVEVLVVPGCPGAKLALSRVQEACEALGVHTNLRLMTVEHETDAVALGFVGSPKVRVEGRDVEDVADRPLGLSCRLYGAERAPSFDAIRRALAAALDRS